MSQISLNIGDVPYTHHAYIVTRKIKAAVDISKGAWYTSTTNGYVDVLSATSGVVNLAGGAFQAMSKSNAVTGEVSGSRSCQFLVKRSRVIVKGTADLVQGASVEIVASGSTVTPDKVQALTTSGSKLGQIFRIRGNKLKTVDNDLIELDVLN